MYPPFQEAIVDIDYEKGIDPYAGLFNLALSTGYAVQSGSWFDVGGERVQGEYNAHKLLFDEGVDDKMLKQLDLFVSKTGYSSINREIEAAEEMIKEIEVKPDKPKKRMSLKNNK
jgi:hypothetical protein